MDKISAFQTGKSRSWVNVHPGVDRMIMGYNKSLMMVKVRFTKDAIGPLHSHSHTQSTYIASGTFEVSIDGETSMLSVGDTFFVAPNLLHGVVCKEEGVLVDVFHPIREDSLTK